MLIFETSTAEFKSPDEIFGDLFLHVQLSRVFGDYKTFADCTPKAAVQDILEEYLKQKDQPDFDLKKYVYEHFDLPDLNHTKYEADTTITVTQHIHNLWNVLSRKVTSQVPNSSLINLPYAYVVPGGRFREIFYWDSYFMMLGLQESGRHDLVQSMVDNFSFLIHTFGYIPNGNRTYFLSRSHPPFYSLMIELLTATVPDACVQYLPYLEKEYSFWMKGQEQLMAENNTELRVVRMPDGEIMNRYWDNKDGPRPEGYGKEIVLSKDMNDVEAHIMYKNIRAACESGWDFSSRWMRDGVTIQTCYTTDIIPIDLNCLLYHLEFTIAKTYALKGEQDKEQKYKSLSEKRKNAVLKYCWNEQSAFFMDYDFKQKTHTPCFSAAASFPLFFKICHSEQARMVSEKLEKDFLKAGGFVTTLVSSPFQWDSPNGWAPLQWIIVQGLLNYGEKELAQEGARRWIRLNDEIFYSTGKLIEKYNVLEMSMRTGGNEYSLQDGFGWTNGVYLKLQKIL